MARHGIPASDWPGFFGRLSHDCHGWLLAVDRCPPEHLPERVIDGLPLREIAAELGDGSPCDDDHPGRTAAIACGQVRITAGYDGVAASPLTLPTPRGVWVTQSEYLDDLTVLIDPGDGCPTILHLYRDPTERHVPRVA